MVDEAWSAAAITVAEGGLGLHRKPEQRWAAGDALDGCNAALPFDFLGDEEGFIGMLTFSENKDAFGGFDHARSNERSMRVRAFGHQPLPIGSYTHLGSRRRSWVGTIG